jgi:hypothetical protein
MIDWSACPAVERSADTLSGAWRFKNTRVPVKALFENLESGATVDQFLEWFPGGETETSVGRARMRGKEFGSNLALCAFSLIGEHREKGKRSRQHLTFVRLERESVASAYLSSELQSLPFSSCQLAFL